MKIYFDKTWCKVYILYHIILGGTKLYKWRGWKISHENKFNLFYVYHMIIYFMKTRYNNIVIMYALRGKIILCTTYSHIKNYLIDVCSKW
jgi:hypothetical protein